MSTTRSVSSFARQPRRRSSDAAALPAGVSPSALEGLRSELEAIARSNDNVASALVDQTAALARSFTGEGGVGFGLEQQARRLASPLLAVPLVGLFRSLFGGGRPAEPAPLVKYALPLALRVEDVYRGPGGVDEVYRNGVEVRTGSVSAVSPAPASPDLPAAFDTEWWRGQRDSVAGAVRDALLHGHPLADAIGEL